MRVCDECLDELTGENYTLVECEDICDRCWMEESFENLICPYCHFHYAVDISGKGKECINEHCDNFVCENCKSIVIPDMCIECHKLMEPHKCECGNIVNWRYENCYNCGSKMSSKVDGYDPSRQGCRETKRKLLEYLQKGTEL